MTGKLSIVWLGDNGFPFGFATIQKVRLICKGLVHSGVETTVVNRWGVHDANTKFKIKKKGRFENVNYIYTSRIPFRPKKRIKRNYRKIVGFLNEVKFLGSLYQNNRLDAGIVHTKNIVTVLYYKIISKIFHFPIILLYVELYSAMSTRKGLIQKVNNYYFEKFSFKLFDGIFPISDYLISIIKKRAPNKPILKVPMITDFDRFKGYAKTNNIKYFLFCGAVEYIEIILFDLKSFDLLSSQDYSLYLVVNGSPKYFEILTTEISKLNKNHLIKTFSNLTDDQLTNLYYNARGLLIPLRPTIQDKARFPHKIGEYCASGNPIITTKYGEIINYFEDCKTALIADKYDIQKFSDKMNFVISNPGIAKSIGENGKLMALKYFNYEYYGKKIKSFILSLMII